MVWQPCSCRVHLQRVRNLLAWCVPLSNPRAFLRFQDEAFASLTEADAAARAKALEAELAAASPPASASTTAAERADAMSLQPGSPLPAAAAAAVMTAPLGTAEPSTQVGRRCS